MDSEELIIDAGLTVIVKPADDGITEDDWVRVQIVAQKLAIFAGASLSTAGEAKSSFLHALTDGFEHEYGNLEASIKAVLNMANLRNKPLARGDISDIEGRLEFTHQFIQSSIDFYRISPRHELNTIGVSELLHNLIEPLDKYNDTHVEKNLDDGLNQYNIMKPWQAVLTELIRNAYKHGPTSYDDRTGVRKKLIRISAVIEGENVVVEIFNEYVEHPKSAGNHLKTVSRGAAMIDSLVTSLNGRVGRFPDKSKGSYVTKVWMPTM